MSVKSNENIIEEAISNILKNDKLIIKNIPKIDLLMNILYTELSKYDFDCQSMIGKSKIYSINERINFVKQFYNRHNINFNVDEIINDGTIGFIHGLPLEEYSETQYENETGKFSKYKPDLSGYQRFINTKNIIDVYNTGYLFDSVVLAHEISHYRNQFYNFNEISDLFTEALAFTECTIMAKEILNEEEYNYYIKKQFHVYYYLSSHNRLFFDFITLYQKLGYISYDNYCLLFGNISNNDYIDKLEKIINDKPYDIFNSTRYTISGLLVPYLLNKYEYDNSFLNIIEELHNSINKDEIYQILLKIGLKFEPNNDIINKESINILIDNLNEFLSRELVKGAIK